MPGTLYVVATPIGNLEDITFRAVRILSQVSLIACEDTRHSRILLQHYGIDRPLVSYHDHNEQERTADLIVKLQDGVSIALISDAGTPLISDPGYRLVHRAIEDGIQVTPIPGPSALLAALAGSGLPTASFHFGGFLAPKSSQRRKQLEEIREIESTLVFYEAPHRILEALADVQEILGPRPVVLTRELTKIHEEFLRGDPSKIIEILRSRPTVKGEITLLIGKPVAPAISDLPVKDAVEDLMRTGVARMDAMKAVARERGMSKREVYAALEAKHFPTDL